jgi:sialate O-acetylesterase
MKQRFPLVLLLALAPLSADVQLPALFSDNMLLQRDAPVQVWGKAEPGERVTVRFRGQSVTAAADAAGRWSAFLAPMPAGGPDDLTIAGANTVTIRNVLVGDVWVASGQSNMDWPVSRSNNAENEIRTAANPRIRLFKVARNVADYPLEDVAGSWAPSSPDSVPEFSAVGYFFARNLEDKLKVPVGVIHTAWGGTPAESWTSLPALSADPLLLPHIEAWARTLRAYSERLPGYERRLKEWEKQASEAAARGQDPPRRPNAPSGPGHPWTPAGLYNAMIAPLTRYAIRGAIWYQGESNAGSLRAPLYNRLFETMIRDWRRSWGQGDFPFLFVQLANYDKIDADGRWPELRNAQSQTLALRNTGMAVTIDIGDPADIHPRNKQEVGRRLGLAARAIAYGEPLVYSGPMLRRVARDASALRLWFDHVGGGLTARGGELKSFQLAGPDRQFVPAAARIDGDSIVVTATQVPEPAAVRYGWSNNPECNLYNAEGLPALPFEWHEGL